MAKSRGKLGGHYLRVVEAVDEYLRSVRHFWPMTLRGIHYALLDTKLGQSGGYQNTQECYKALGVALAKARLEGRIRWESMTDNHREVMTSEGHTDADTFIRSEAEIFLKGYHRDRAQNQPVVHELWIEKDTLARFAHEVAVDYGISVIVARGYSSISFVNDCRNRVNRRWRDSERVTRILYFGDLDPSGWNMLPAMMDTLQREMELGDRIEGVRCGLMKEHVRRFRLPSNPNALKDDAWQRTHGDPTKKKGDPRAEAYKKQFGKLAVELDALGPERLQNLVREAIEANIDMDVHEAELAREERDIRRIDKLRKQIEKHLPRVA